MMLICGQNAIGKGRGIGHLKILIRGQENSTGDNVNGFVKMPICGEKIIDPGSRKWGI